MQDTQATTATINRTSTILLTRGCKRSWDLRYCTFYLDCTKCTCNIYGSAVMTAECFYFSLSQSSRVSSVEQIRTYCRERKGGGSGGGAKSLINRNWRSGLSAQSLNNSYWLHFSQDSTVIFAWLPPLFHLLVVLAKLAQPPLPPSGCLFFLFKRLFYTVPPDRLGWGGGGGV